MGKNQDQKPKAVEMKAASQPKKPEAKQATPPKVDPKLSATTRDVRFSQNDIEDEK